ncbi:MAG: hypothetical protein L6R41_006375 [Letrouitia leprolyta]|nr:MAG: hypothetical protein L6R41_006375 [Letrouitia leprolyta]
MPPNQYVGSLSEAPPLNTSDAASYTGIQNTDAVKTGEMGTQTTPNRANTSTRGSGAHNATSLKAEDAGVQTTPSITNSSIRGSGVHTATWLKVTAGSTQPFQNATSKEAGYCYRVNQLKRLATISKNIPWKSDEPFSPTWFIDFKLMDLRTPKFHNINDAKLMMELEDLSEIKDAFMAGGVESELIDRLIKDKFKELVDANRG